MPSHLKTKANVFKYMQILERKVPRDVVSHSPPTFPKGSQVSPTYQVAMEISNNSCSIFFLSFWQFLWSLMTSVQPLMARYLLFSKQFNFGDAGRVTREISGGFYGLHLHNMHKLISLERIKDYGTKIALSRKSKRIWISKDKKRKKDHKIEMTQFQGMVLYRKPGARGSK